MRDLLTVVKSMREMKKFIVLSKLEAAVRRNNIRHKAWSMSKLVQVVGKPVNSSIFIPADIPKQ
jgi:hypothetical protein